MCRDSYVVTHGYRYADSESYHIVTVERIHAHKTYQYIEE
jgi:hypothetical protein